MRLVKPDVEIPDAEREIDSVEVVERDWERRKVRDEEEDSERRQRLSHVRRDAAAAPR